MVKDWFIIVIFLAKRKNSKYDKGETLMRLITSRASFKVSVNQIFKIKNNLGITHESSELKSEVSAIFVKVWL